jgi:alanine racemase
MNLPRIALTLAVGLIVLQPILPAAPPLPRGKVKQVLDVQSLNSWQEIDRLSFENNVRAIRTQIGDKVKLCAVMKADAYGHGISLMIPTAIKLGVSVIGIASNDEARVARELGFKGELLRVRTATLGEVESGLKYNIEESLGNLAFARQVSEIAAHHGHSLKFHLKLNSGGMSRNGLEMSTEAGKQEALELIKLPHLQITGIYTHNPVEDRKEVLERLAVFQGDYNYILQKAHLDRGKITVHMCNSFSTYNVPEAHLDMVRPGMALYEPPDDTNAVYKDLKRIWQFKTRVATVNAYPAGNTVSYDRTFTLKRDSLIANLPVGYSDGFRRLFTNRGVVLIQGQRFPVVGKVCMNTVLVDVTGHPEIKFGDEVVLFGKQGNEEIGVEEFSKNSDSPSWDEMYTTIGNQNPKVLVN